MTQLLTSRKLLVSAIAVATWLPMAASAQTPERDESKLEEVVVTAQMRTQSMQDVPVSMAAVGGDKLLESGVNKIEDLAAQVPNLKMSETGIGTNLYIRGIGSGINQGFEQSVGMYVDGVYYGRGQLIRAPFLDLERVEVLRGPQNILYGKNSIAGAISMVTAKPTDQPSAMVSALYEPHQNEQVYDVMLSGPLTEAVGARFAFRDRSADGYMKNLTLNRDEPQRNEQTARLILTWKPTDKLDAALKYEHGSFDVTGRQIEIINDQPSTLPSPLFAGLTEGQILRTRLGQSASVLNNSLDYQRSSNGDYSNNDTDNATMTINYQLGEHTLTSISSWLSYKYNEFCDCDFTGAPFFNVHSQEDYDQYSQELRLVSPAGKALEYIAGAYYQTSSQKFTDQFALPANSIVPTILNFSSPGAGTAIATAAAPRLFTQDTDLFSAFGQLTWNVADDIRVIAGGRFSTEDKSGARRFSFYNQNGNPVTLTEISVLSAVLKAEAHDLKGDRSESNFAPQLAVQFDFTSDIMGYATLSRGNKSGGYDARSNKSPTTSTLPAGAFEYKPEKANGIEIGTKAIVASGAGEVSIAAFRTEYQDLQVSIFDGILGFNVGNAAEAVSQGVELDSRWLVTRGLLLSASLAYLDFEFQKYPNGQCVQGQVPTSPPFNCNYKGQTNQYVAKWSGNIGADYTLTLTDYLELRNSLEVFFTSDYSPAQNLDARVQQSGYAKVNARVALMGNGDQWELALVGKNLTDRKVVSYAADAPLAYSFFRTVAHYGMIEEPRNVAVQGIYRF